MKIFLNKVKHAFVGRKGIGRSMTIAIIIAVVLFNILAYSITNTFGLYAYSKKEEPYVISGNTDSLFASAIAMDKKVTITFCMSEEKLKTHDTGSFVLDTAKQFEERYPGFIELRFVNLLTKLDDETKEIVKFYEYSDIACPNEVDGQICGNITRYTDLVRGVNLATDAPKCAKCGGEITDFKNNAVTVFQQSSIIFETGNGPQDPEYSYRVLTDMYTSAGFVDFYILDSSSSIVSYNGEEVMAAMISWVLQNEHPTVYFTQNHGETADVAFSNLLTCAGYYVEIINLRKEEIPKDAGMVIISNPTTDFETSIGSAHGEIQKLDDYLSLGGKVYVSFDPYVKNLPNLEGLLTAWGIQMASSVENGYFARYIVKESAQAITKDGYTFIATYAENELAQKIYGRLSEFGTDKVLMSNVAKLNLISSNEKGSSVSPILVSGGSSSAYAGGEKDGGEGNYAIAACATKVAANGKEGTLFVLPTAYITATDAFISDSYSNKDFLYATLEVLFDSNIAPHGCNQILYDNQLLENLTMGNARLYTAIILAVPVCLAIVGTVIIVRRKNR